LAQKPDADLTLLSEGPGVARQRVAALTKAEGDSAIKSDPRITGTLRRDGRGNRAMLVELAGEFDIRYHKVLENVLSRCLTSGRPTLVDLSRVTFMDSQCVRELAIHYQLGGGSLALCDPSREVEFSVAARDLEGWIDFVHTTARSRPVPPIAGSA
jgi:anti-anti-sigma factor